MMKTPEISCQHIQDQKIMLVVFILFPLVFFISPTISRYFLSAILCLKYQPIGPVYCFIVFLNSCYDSPAGHLECTDYICGYDGILFKCMICYKTEKNTFLPVNNYL